MSRNADNRVVELAIAAIGSRGDGLAEHDGRRVFVPRTVPGDVVRVRLTGRRGDALVGEIAGLVTAGSGRAKPACKHFDHCGGCSVQHLDGAAYAELKLALVRDAFARRGLADLKLDPLHGAVPATRRRARFGARSHGSRIAIGFHRAASHGLVDIGECPVLAAPILALLPRLRRALTTIMARRDRWAIDVNLTDTGLDVVIEADRAPALADREALAAVADAGDLARLSWRDRGELEPVAMRRPVRVRFGDVDVDLPPGAFLQATQDGERAIQAATQAGVGDASSVLDLYAGCGTLSFRLCAGAHVRAVEIDSAMSAAITGAAKRHGLDGRMTVETRDLNKRPYTPDELTAFEAVVFDPPRAGARGQAGALAASGVPTIVAVSCNPATLARDARLLVDDGYRLDRVVPIDQFLWSTRIELVALFTR